MSARVSLAGRVAIVTGAGRGLGRAYALDLAARGAKVVVNDLGTDGAGQGSDTTPATEVVDAIRGAGGEAVVDTGDISDPAVGRGAVERAVTEFGRVDIVVNNAGICGNQPFADAGFEDFDLYWRVHVLGHLTVTKAAWPLMSEQGYGRIVMTESAAGLYGLAGQATYAAAKGAIHGLMRTLALEGAPLGIVVNSIAPGGFSRMHEAAIDDPVMLEQTRQAMPAELVAPVIAWLASDACTSGGDVYTAWGGRVARTAIGAGPGLISRQLSPELIAAEQKQLGVVDGFYQPLNALDEVGHWVGTVMSSGVDNG